MENETTTNPFGKMTPEQLKAAKRQIAKTLITTVVVRVGVSVAVSLAARAIVKAIEAKEAEGSSTTN